MTNPINVLYSARQLVQQYAWLDVLYLNNSTIKIDHVNWDVLIDALLHCRLTYLCTTGRAYAASPNFVSVCGGGQPDLGFSADFCRLVLCPFILTMELKELLKEADLPGRVVWTGSSTCNRRDFSFDDPQHVKPADSFYAHKYFVHLLQPALNEQLRNSGVQSFEGSPGLIITGTSDSRVCRSEDIADDRDASQPVRRPPAEPHVHDAANCPGPAAVLVCGGRGHWRESTGDGGREGKGSDS